MGVNFHKADELGKNFSIVDASSETGNSNNDLVPEFHDSSQLMHTRQGSQTVSSDSHITFECELIMKQLVYLVH